MMVQMKDVPASLLNVFSVLFFHLNSGTIHLAHFCEAQSQVIGPSQPIVASVGDDIILPCRLEPAKSAGGMTVEWSRLDLNPRFVHVWHEGQDLLNDQYPTYRGRTSLSIDKLKLGDISLKLSNVKLTDKGRYRCLFPDLDAKSFVDLAISSTSSPVIAGIDTNGGNMVLQCESKGWHPEPEVLWLDGEGNVLSAGPTETVRGPDDLYTVSSRVIVDKSNNITCRVQQNIINQSRETHIHVSGDFLMFQSHSSVPLTISVLVALLCIMAAIGFVLWKRKKSKKLQSSALIHQDNYVSLALRRANMLHVEEGHEQRVGETNPPTLKNTTESKPLVKEGKQMRHVEEMKKIGLLNQRMDRLDVELKKKEEELKNVEKMIDSLLQQKEEVRNLIQQTTEIKNIETIMEDSEKQADSLQASIDHKAIDKAQGYLKLKTIMTDGNWKVKEVIQVQQSLQLNAQKLQQTTEAVIQRMTEWKKEMETHMEQSRKELEETRRQMEESNRKSD